MFAILFMRVCVCEIIFIFVLNYVFLLSFTFFYLEK